MGDKRELREIPVEDGHIAVLDTGSGPSVVLLHGGTLDHRMWLPQVEALRADYRVIALDSRGHGASSTPHAPFRHDQDLIAVLDALEIQRAVLVGLSMGASIAVDTVLEHPDRVTGVVVSGAGASSPDFRDRWILDIFQTWAIAAQDQDVDSWLEAFMRFAAGPHRDLEDVDQDVVRRVQAMAVDTLQQHVPEGAPVLPDWAPNAARRLGEIDVPVLAINGGGDADDHLRMPAELIDAVPDGELVTIPIAAHYPNLEFPEQYDAELRRFLTRLA